MCLYFQYFFSSRHLHQFHSPTFSGSSGGTLTLRNRAVAGPIRCGALNFGIICAITSRFHSWTADLSAERNYIFGMHPHGILSFGATTNFCTEATGFSQLFPGITPHLITLRLWFFYPILHDYFLLGGACSSSNKSLDYLLSNGATRGAKESLERIQSLTRPLPIRRPHYRRAKSTCGMTTCTIGRAMHSCRPKVPLLQPDRRARDVH